MTTSAVDDDALLEELLLPVLEQLEKDDVTIPLLPHVANQVLMLTNNPDSDASHLTALITQDLALSAQILRIANSPACGARYPIESLNQAIARIGMNSLGGTVLSLTLQAGVFNVTGYSKEVKELWAHSAATGMYAKAIARMVGQNPDSVFLSGLLHAIGKPFVVHLVNENRPGSTTAIPWSVMVRVMKESYIELGRKLSESWHLPKPVQDTVVLHEDCAYHLSTCPTRGATITNLAIHLAAHLLDPATVPKDKLRALPVIKALNLSEDDLDALMDMQETIRDSVSPMLV